MTGDVLSYLRAVRVSLWGLVFQFFMAVALLVYAVYERGHSIAQTPEVSGKTFLADHAAATAGVFAVIGLPVWLTLALLFDLHRRERLEAIEAQRLAEDASASVFEESAADLRVAARRLEGFQKYALPVLSLSVAASLLIVGAVRFSQAGPLLSLANFTIPVFEGWAIAVGGGTAFAGFVFARFVSGMAKQRVWSALRAGASYAVGTALLGLLLAIAHFLDLIADQDALLRAAQLIVPGVMIALGAEFVLNFVLNLYRPRRPGEEDRPAFDSRLLGLLAAPDKIAENVGEALNYQFGVRVTETWFYRLVKVWWPAFVGAAVLVVWSMTAFVVIREDQRAIILANGRPVAENVGSGLHLKWPWPFGTVYIPESVVELRDADDRGGVTVERFRSKTATGVRTMNLGTNPPSPSAPAILWTNEHTDVEIFNIVQPTRLAELDPPDATEDDQGGADLAIVALEAPVLYSVRDVGAFDRFAVPEDRDELLKLMGQREVTQMLGSRSIDEILGGDRMAFAHRVRERLELAFGENGLDAGIEILSITTGVVHPPQKTATGFERVVQAVPIRDRRIEQARKDEIELLAGVAGSVAAARQIVDGLNEIEGLRALGRDEAEIRRAEVALQQLIQRSGGDAGRLLLEASSKRWEANMGARAKAERYRGELALYRASPELYMARSYLNSVHNAMRESRIVWYGRNVLRPRIDIDLETTDTSIGVFDPEAGAALNP